MPSLDMLRYLKLHRWKRIQESLPCLHVGLSMLLSHRVIELERSQTSTSHKQESDVLDILNVVLIGVLQNKKFIGTSGKLDQGEDKR